MSTVDEAVEAGARAANLTEYPDTISDVLSAAWPVLSAGLRELVNVIADDQDALALLDELDRIDRELGIEDDHQWVIRHE